MEQRLVTVHLTNEYGGADFAPGVREHLGGYLADGWTIAEFRPVSTSQANYSAAWIVVLLTRPRAAAAPASDAAAGPHPATEPPW